MEVSIEKMLEDLSTVPGQGGIFEQFEKRLRKMQRRVLFEMLEGVSEGQAKRLPVVLYKSVLTSGNKMPSLLRFYLPTWRGHDEVFWQALGDYAILMLHRVKDLEYMAESGKMKIEYFVRASGIGGRVRSPEQIREILQKIACLVDNEMLPTDFTHFRRMAERRGQIGELSQEKAVAFGALIKLLPV
ncbi:MAG: hypothetical protein P4L43_02345 [Syntrophobacteraceae bacterium]|nr:hypothetical protein [Syntrophobacteraceae bacterium]